MENPGSDEKASANIKVDIIFIEIVNSLLDSLSEKDEKIRSTIESSLIRVAKKRYDEIVDVFCEYRKKHSKMGDTQVATILRVVEYVALHLADKMQHDTALKCIELSISEMTKSQDHCVPIQKPCQDILVSIGRHHCRDVMEALTKHLDQNQVAHFMILNTTGALATANVLEIAVFIKPTLGLILPTLALIKLDHVKQAYAFAFARFCEAYSEYPANKDAYDISTEISIIYDTFLNQWLLIRDPKVSSDILNALSFMYPLLPSEKIVEQISRVIPLILSQYRRSIDRMSVTQFLASVIKAALDINTNMLNGLSDGIISSLFDLVCVNPDYEKPQTIKGHYEVLRCFDLLSTNYKSKIADILLVHLRSNNERERIKSLLVITHLTNTADHLIELKLSEIVGIMKTMLTAEKSIKIKMVLLKTMIAFMQKNFIQDKEFFTFLIRNSCKLNKINSEHGTSDEHQDFVEACINTMFILSSTVGTVDDILKIELLQCFLKLEFTDICSTIAKCLSYLFNKNPEILVQTNETPTDDEAEVVEPVIPAAESIFVRCIVLMGNYQESQRITNILVFLKSYCTNLYKQLVPLWNEKLPNLLNEVNGNVKESKFNEMLFDFVTSTVKDVDDVKFADALVDSITEHMPLYTPLSQNNNQLMEFKVPNMDAEKGMLLKVLGLVLCYVRDETVVITKIEMIINLAKAEKLDKHGHNEDYEALFRDSATALGFVSNQHLNILMKKLLSFMVDDGSVKKSNSFFSNLNFIKDSSKEAEIYKMKILVIQSLNSIVENAPRAEIIRTFEDKVMDYLMNQLMECKEVFIRKLILSTFLKMTTLYLSSPPSSPKDHKSNFKNINDLLKMIMKICNENPLDNLPLFPIILKLSTALISMSQDENIETNDLLTLASHYFFTMAQNLKSKFESLDEDNHNSYLAKYLNASLPELNLFIKAILEQQHASIASLDDINTILEIWLKDKNNEVRICAGHVYNNTLDIYMKTMKIGCEAPSKFNQTGSLLGKIVPRCIDSNATVRQTSIEILKRILEIACIYETLTIADNKVTWVNELVELRERIVTDDAKEIYKIAGDLAKIIATRLSNYQYLHFSKCLLYSLNDQEHSSAIGAAIVLKFFMQIKGAEMFHAIPELIKECIHAVKTCDIVRARSGVLKSMLALTKHHPKLVCNEILGQPLPLDENIVEYWQKTITTDPELTGIILDNFIATVTTSCLYEQQHQDKKDDSQKAVTTQPFAIICVLGEIFKCQEIKSELKSRFTEIFCMLLSTLATYIHLLPPCGTTTPVEGAVVVKSSKKNKFFAPKVIRMNPCQIVLDAFKTFLDNLKMQQISNVLSVCPQLASSTDLNNFIEILTPLSIATASEVGINSSAMKQIVTTLSKYVSSPYDTQRIASTGFYSHLIPLKPYGEISSVIMLHLNSSLNDPDPLVRGLSIRGMAYLCCLTEHDIDKYSEMCLTALLKGIDDYNKNCFINIPLESMRGLSKILQTLPHDKFEMFQVSLAIRIRPFFENASTELRESAILLFGDLCNQKALLNLAQDGEKEISEPLLEQLHANLFTLLLHLSEDENMINRASKITLKNICALLGASKVNKLAQDHLIEHGNLNYSFFIKEFVKLIGEELNESVPDFINSCIPFLKSQWPEIRGNAAILVGLLNNHNRANQQIDNIGHKISLLLKDDENLVKVKAAEALGYIYGDV